MAAKRTVLDVLQALSLANLALLGVWIRLIPYKGPVTYFLPVSPFNSYVAAMLNTLIVGGVIFTATRFAEGRAGAAKFVLPAVYALVALLAINASRRWLNLGVYDVYAARGRVAAVGLLLGGATVGVAVMMALFKWRHDLSRFPRIGLALLPFVFATFGQAFYAMANLPPRAEFEARPPAPVAHAASPVMPVVWVIFDELDYRLAFEKRPSGVLLPNFDRLVASSIVATRAYAPANLTDISIPALLSGQPVEKVATLAPRELQARRPDGSEFAVDSSSTILDDFSRLGVNRAMFGWYHPYCRIFSGLNACAWYPSYLFPASQDVATVVGRQLRSVVELPHYSMFGASLTAGNHIDIIQRMRRDVRGYLERSGGEGFVFLHYPIPHGMYVYDAATDTYGVNRDLVRGYVDHLVLTDSALGEIRSSMEAAGTWSKALVVISSDHHLRKNMTDRIVDERVPFIVKLPGQTHAVVTSRRFETLRTRELIRRVVAGELVGAAQVVRWMAAGSRDE